MRPATLLFIMVLPLALAAQANAQQQPQYRAFWADAFHYGYKTPAEADRLLDDVELARANAVFVQVRRRADSYYLRTKEVPAQDSAYAPGFDALAYLLDKAHARGIEVHAWFIVYPVWPATIAPPSNPEHVWHRHGPRASGDDMWMQVNAQGQPLGSFDPGHPAVQSYLADVITDPLNHYDIDGVHLDYIRYDDAGNYGGNPKSIERFLRQELRGATNPAPGDPAWSDFRRRQVTQLVRQIYLRSIAAKPRVKVSAALISWGNGPVSDAGFRSTDAYATVFQDWRAWLEEGILDIAMPMHYFRDATNATFLDRWTEFAGARQYKRSYLPGIAPYLNPIPDSINQVRRILSAPGPLGVAFYSYASTNTLDAGGFPVTPNDEFYRQAGAFFGAAAKPPELPWKTSPTDGHIMGRLDMAGGDAIPAWLADGATVIVGSDTGRDFARSSSTDGTGFFGFTDLPPDRYRLRVERGGRVLTEATPQSVTAGAVTRFDVRLSAAAFEAVLPRITAAPERAAPGQILVLEGVNLTPVPPTPEGVFAQSVPLPAALGGAQVIVNGAVAPLFSAAPGKLVIQMPYLEAPGWAVVVRQGGMETSAWAIGWAAAEPRILAVNRRGASALEIYATGLGLVEPPIEAGRGADPQAGPLPLVRLPVRVLVNGAQNEPNYAGLAPYQPGLYQINIELPEESRAAGSVQLATGSAFSNTVLY